MNKDNQWFKNQLNRRDFLKKSSLAGLTLSIAPWGFLCSEDDPDVKEEVFYFAVLSDTHVAASDSHKGNIILSQTADILNAFQPGLEFVIVSGDNIDQHPVDELAYYEDNSNTPIHKLAALKARFNMPYYLAMGNHDYYTDYSTGRSVTTNKALRDTLYQDYMQIPHPYYTFEVKGVKFYALNSMIDDHRVSWEPEACGTFGEEQLEWLETELSDGKPCFLYFHHPLALENATTHGWSQLLPFEVPRAESNLNKYQNTVFDGWTDPIYDIISAHKSQIQGIFVGHTHWYTYDEFEGIPVYMTDSMHNSTLNTKVTVDGEVQPMRYHIVECHAKTGEFRIFNADWIIYNLDAPIIGINEAPAMHADLIRMYRTAYGKSI